MMVRWMRSVEWSELGGGEEEVEEEGWVKSDSDPVELSSAKVLFFISFVD